MSSSRITVTPRYEHLSVVEVGDVQKEELERELRKLDLGLFVDAEFDAQFGKLVYSVKLFMGPANPPHLVTDWRDPGTREPLELSWGLFHKVRRSEAENTARRRPLLEEVRAENEERQRKASEENQRHYLEVAADMIPRIRGTKSTVMPRTTNVGAAARRQRRRDLERKLGLR